MLKKIALSISCILCAFSLSQAQIVISAVFDGDLPGELQNGIEIYTLEDITDLSIFGVGSANDGQGSAGEEFTFPEMSVTAQTYMYVTADSATFSDFFGFNSDFVSSDAMSIDGDDAIELFMNGDVIDVFGEIDEDGSGTVWEYLNGWAARNSGTGPDGSGFEIENWTYSGAGGLEGEMTNDGAVLPVPIKVYLDTMANSPDVIVRTVNLAFVPRDITIEVGQTVRWTNPEFNVHHNANGSLDEFPCNPVGFFSGPAEFGEWDFDFTFTEAGIYDYQCDPHITVDMFGTVTVIEPNTPDYPAYDVATVTTTDVDGVADSLNVNCKLEAIVYGVNLRAGGLEFTMIDDDGYGINVFKSTEDCYDVTEGDRLVVKGKIGQDNGLTRIESNAPIDVIATGMALLFPELVQVPLDESHESSFIRVNGVTIDSIVQTGSSGWNIFTTNFNGSYTVRIDSDAIDNPITGGGDIINVVGLGGQFDSISPYTDGYQIAPRDISDIEIVLGTTFLPSSSVSMFPNPVFNLISFETDLQIETIQIYNISGVLVGETVEKQMELNNLTPGVYIVKVYTDQGIWSDRLVRMD